MFPLNHPAREPGRLAAVNTATGETLSYAQLDIESSRVVRVLRAVGLKTGGHFSLIMENHIGFFKFVWAALRAGFYITAINRYLTAAEAAHIVEDSDSEVLISSATLDVSAALGAMVAEHCPTLFSWGGDIQGFAALEPLLSAQPAEPLPVDSVCGQAMLYSSGTTGRPKGVLRPMASTPVTDGLSITVAMAAFGFHSEVRYLSPAPLYHAAPFYYTVGVHSLGGCVYMMEKFDPEDALRCIQEHRITHSQWVPTMFLRMLKLPEAVRNSYDLSSHQLAVHAAAPCPVQAKQQMIAWWGPILFEYYAGSEGNGTTVITSEEWLQYPGSVGRPISSLIHICDESGVELPAGETGAIYFEMLAQATPLFQYHKAPEKTQQSRHPKHANWSTLGDIGHVNEAGYLYLTDRKAYMIISGGVNIYPQEIEDALVMHERIVDAAVFGVPNEDFGEEVKAVVQWAEGVPQGIEAEAIEQDLMAYCRQHLAAYKIPRSVDFIGELPRLPTGKLYKRILRDKY